nr:MAG TPA: hypothetical protein [Caudoviricetes sp.]
MVSDLFFNCWEALKPYVLVFIKNTVTIVMDDTMGSQQRSLFYNRNVQRLTG